MSSNQSLFEAVLGSDFRMFAFDRGIRPDVSINLSTKSNGTSTSVRTAKLSSAGVTDSRFYCRTVYGHVMSSTSEADLVVFGFARIDDNLSSILYLQPSQFGEGSEISFTLGNMHPSQYYT